MNKLDFNNLYAKTVKVLALQLVNENPNFAFFDNPNGLYEEYMNQKALLHWMYDKEDSLLDRHKVCACLTVAIIKVRLLSGNLQSDKKYKLCNANCVNEQLAFLSSWELLKAFVAEKGKKEHTDFTLPRPFHNDTFEETVSRSLFMANQLNGLSTPLIANMFFLLEKYCEDIKE